MMKLFGTKTSPFVRRVRVLAAETGLEHTLVDTSTEEGQAALRRLSPIWKVPAALIDGHVLFDSHVIGDYILQRAQHAPIRVAVGAARWRELNIQNTIDAALEAGIQLFLAKRDNVDITKVPSLLKNRDRVTSTLEWVAGELRDGLWFSDEDALGMTELSLFGTLEWFRFREVHPAGSAKHFEPFLERHGTRPSLAATRPGV